MSTNKLSYKEKTVLCCMFAGMVFASPAFGDAGKAVYRGDEVSAATRVAASATIIQPAISSCDRALRSVSVNTYNLGGGDGRQHGPMIFRCEQKGGRLHVEFVTGDNREATGITDGQLIQTSGSRTTGAAPKDKHGAHIQVIEFNYNYE